MPISSIIEQPATDDLKAAYRPIVLKVRASRTDAAAQPPVVYCDIYVNDVYYKSQEKTQYAVLGSTNSDWQFDIQDACQEILRSIIAANGGSTIVTASDSFATIYCKFRSSGFDVDGFITPEDTAPIQGTGSNSPVAGTGTQSNSFYIVNAVLQHENNQDLATHLDAYKRGTWDSAAHPLTHRNESYQVCVGNSDYFPIVYTGSAALSCIKVNYTLNDGTTGVVNDCGSVYPDCPVVSGISIGSENNGDGTQTFTFTWGTPSPLLTGIVIQYRIDGSSDPFTNVSGSTASGRTLTLPLGLYEFKFQMNGACNAATSSTSTGQGIEASTCVPVAIVGSPSLPDGHSGVGYGYSFSVSGDSPFSLSAIVNPAWMTIAVTGSSVGFTGTPDISDEGTAIPVSFTIDNACGSVDFADTIDVTSLARTLTFFAALSHSTFSQVGATLNAAIDVPIGLVHVFAEGYNGADCDTSAIAGAQVHDLTIGAGSTTNSGSVFPTGDWTTANSFSMYNCEMSINGIYYGFVNPGDVITMGSYTVTIIFDGC